MGDTLTTLLPYLPGLPFAGACVLLYRLWSSAVRDLRDERRDHSATQERLDGEQERRRNLEDEVAAVRREVAGLRAEVAALRKQLESL